MLGMQAVTAVTISGALVFGMMLALLGSLKLALAKRLDLGEGRVGSLLSALNLALIPMMLLSGLLIDRWTVRGVMICGSLVLALAVFSLSVRLSYARAFLALLVAGLGGAAVSAASVVLMPQAFFPGEESASLNLGYVFFALGALVTPALTDVLLGTLGWRRTVALVAFFCLVPAFVAAVAPVDLPQKADLNALVGHEALWLAGLVFFFYAPLEASISVWATTYLTDLGHGERRAAWLLSGFWAMFLASRLLAAVWQHLRWLTPEWDPWVLVVPSLLAAVVLGNLAGSGQRGSARVGLLLLGFLLGPVLPTLVGMVFRCFPQETGTAYGTLFAVGSTGSLLLAPFIGTSARRHTVQSALRIPMLLALGLTAAALVFGLMG
jgi:fucose permease